MLTNSLSSLIPWLKSLCLGITFTSFTFPAFAQPITTAVDGTGTIINIEGNLITIQGGSLSGDGQNLFHSFQTFGLNPEQIANFLTNPQISNILGRVVGGEPSLINGLIQVMGGNSNLYLLNPAGIVFGAGASLNIPGDFTATTATGIGFGDNSWFNAFGSNDYSSLIGNPGDFTFEVAQPGTIINGGDLTVNQGNNVTLLGNNVINTGNITAPQGSITIASVPGTSRIRISQPGQLLSLEIEPPRDTKGAVIPFTPLDLPGLLAQTPANFATGLTVEGDGNVVGQGINVADGSTKETTLIFGQVNTASTAGQGGEINLLGQQVGTVNAQINASGTQGGGQIRIGGDYQGKGRIPNAQQTFINQNTNILADATETGTGGRIIVWGDDNTRFLGNISATGGMQSGDGGFIEVSGKNNLLFQGTVDTSAEFGENGTLLLDPTDINIVAGGTNPGNAGDGIWAFAEDVGTQSIGADTIAILLNSNDLILQATNDINVDSSVNYTDTTERALTLEAGNSIIFANNTTIASTLGALNVTLNSGTGTISLGMDAGVFSKGGNITLNSGNTIDTSAGILSSRSNNGGGDIQLNAVGNINTGTIQSIADITGQSGSITLNSAGGNILATRAIEASSFGTADGNRITITTDGNISTSTIDSSAINSGARGNAGDVEIRSNTGQITTGLINTRSLRDNGSGGNVKLSAASGINTGVILSSTESNTSAGQGGSVELSTTNGNIDSTAITSFARSNTGNAGDGGSIIVTATNGNISTFDVRSGSYAPQSPTGTSGNGGAIRFSSGGEININTRIDSTSFAAANPGTGGEIDLQANDKITVGSINTAKDDFAPSPIPSATINFGDISLTADEIDFTGGNGRVFGEGAITLQPFNPNQAIAVGDTVDTAALDITQQDLNALAEGFSARTIGRDNGSGTLTVPVDLTLNDSLTLRSPLGTINTTGTTLSGTDDATISLEANQILLGNLINPGRDISLTSNDAININTSTVNSSSPTGGGDINISAVNDITVGDLNSSGGVDVGGDINLTSSDGGVTTGNLTSSGDSAGGDINVVASTQITTQAIDSSSNSGKGGDVSLDPSGDIQVSSINTQGGTVGGSVDITTQSNFRATDTFTANGLPTSIFSYGPTQSGDITIRHGGDGKIPFVVGNAATNGTAGAISSGDFAILPTQSYLFTEQRGNIQIISTDPPRPNTLKLDLAAIDSLIRDLFGFDPNLRSLKGILIHFPLGKSKVIELSVENTVTELESQLTQEFEQHLGLSGTATMDLDEIQATLQEITATTKSQPAVIYVFFDHSAAIAAASNQFSSQLELILVTASGQPIRKKVSISQREVLRVANDLRTSVTNFNRPQGYRTPAQKIYNWLVTPLESELQEQKLDHLIFIMPTSLRSIPLAALHDGEKFVIEKYGVSLMPSLSLTDSRYKNISGAKVLAMGAAEFADAKPLPAVPVELKAIAGNLWPGDFFLNQDFTVKSMQTARTHKRYGIVHLATHGEFKSGDLKNSYIQLWDTKLSLSQLSSLGLHKPPLDLLVLSACNTALGDAEAELGFAGLAVLAGVKSALGSLWYVSDEGTVALMTNFYGQLRNTSVKVEALRQAQLAMMRGESKIVNGEITTPQGNFPLPQELAKLGDVDFSHPYYWSSFTLIGSPW